MAVPVANSGLVEAVIFRFTSQIDPAAQDAAEYAPDDFPDEIVVKGAGGTDFRSGFEWLDEQEIQPAVCLCFTDMECPDYPEAEPGFSVVWVN